MLSMVAGGDHPAICYTSWDGQLQYGLILPGPGSAPSGRGKLTTFNPGLTPRRTAAPAPGSTIGPLRGSLGCDN